MRRRPVGPTSCEGHAYMKPFEFPARPVNFGQRVAFWLRLTGRTGAHAFSTGDFRITRVAAPAAVVRVRCHVHASDIIVFMAKLKPCMSRNTEARGALSIRRRPAGC